VVASVKPGAEAQAAKALAETLGLPLEMASEIISSAPIVLLKGMAPPTATAVLAALASVSQAGANLAISAAPDGAMPHIDWPAPPVINGHPLDAFKPGATGFVPKPPTRPAASDAASLKCPHCGGTIDLHVVVAGASRATPARAAGPGPGMTALPEVPVVSGPAAPANPPAGGPRTGPMDLEEFERGVGGGGPSQQATGDELLRQLDASLPEKAAGPRTPGAGAAGLPPSRPATPSVQKHGYRYPGGGQRGDRRRRR